MCICVYRGDTTLNVFFFTATRFETFEHLLKQHNTEIWDPPVHLNFCSRKARLATFHNWPSTASQTPEKLSKGGFFYTGEFLNKYIKITNM